MQFEAKFFFWDTLQLQGLADRCMDNIQLQYTLLFREYNPNDMPQVSMQGETYG